MRTLVESVDSRTHPTVAPPPAAVPVFVAPHLPMYGTDRRSTARPPILRAECNPGASFGIEESVSTPSHEGRTHDETPMVVVSHAGDALDDSKIVADSGRP